MMDHASKPNQSQQAVATLPQPRFIHDFFCPILMQEMRRLGSALGHIITVTAATGIISGLFLYVFHDFINHQLYSIDTTLAASGRRWVGAAIIMVSAAAVARYLRDLLLRPRDWGQFLGLQGYAPTAIKQSKKTFSLILATLSMMIATAVVHHSFGPLAPVHLYISFFCLSYVIAVTVRKINHNQTHDKERSPNQSQTGVHPPLTAWRASRLLGNEWKGSGLRVFAALPILFGTTSLAMGQPPPLTQICILAGGIILSWTVPILIADDLKSTWIERQSAVSHEQWIKAWQSIFWGWVKPLALTTMILTTVSTVLTPAQMPTSQCVINILSCGLLAGFPVWMAPAFVMQIDGKRVLTNILMQTLLFVFAGTALMAIPWIAPALWVIHREAHKYQGGRFARGSIH
jgi:hypothetical protein